MAWCCRNLSEPLLKKERNSIYNSVCVLNIAMCPCYFIITENKCPPCLLNTGAVECIPNR